MVALICRLVFKNVLFVYCQAARTVLHSAEPVSQMLNDWKQIDFEGIARQAMWTFSESAKDDYELVYERKCERKTSLKCFPCTLNLTQ